MEGVHNDGSSADPPMTSIERQMQVTHRENDEAEKTLPPSRHKEESAGSSASPSRQRTDRTARSSKQPDREARSSRQPDRSARSSKEPDDKTARLEEKLHEMRKQMGDMRNSLKEKAARNLDNLVHRVDSPFIPSIANFPLPPRFKVPPLENFNGTKDPFDYLEAFKTIIGQRRGRPPTHLLSVKQMEGESLRAYVHCFNKEAMQIDRPKEDITLTAFMAGRRKDVEDRKQEPVKQKVLKFSKTPERKRTTTPTGKFSSFTPLNTPIDKLLMQIQDDPSLQWPGKIRSDPNSRPKNLYCRFHRDHGHLTEDCVALKEQVETLIRQSKLQKYVSRPDNARPPKPQGPKERTENPKPGTAREIRTIVGGPATGGISRTSRKAYARQVHNIFVVQRTPKNIRLNDQIISFSEEDARGTHQPHDNALIIAMNIADFTTKRVMIDNDSSVDILYLPAYQQMKLDKEKLRPIGALLVGFIGDKICLVGIVTLPITIGTYPKQVSKTVDFLVVDCPSAYNTIIGRPTLNRLHAVTSTYHLLIKFPTEHGKRRFFALERNNAIMEEVDKLLAANFIKEVFYPDWLANVVMVKKATGKWWMCIDFTDLNKACPKDSFPLSRIDQLVDSTTGHKLLTFMDAFSGKTVEVYIDDILVKSKEEDDHLKDLEEMFNTLRKYQMKLNPSKCAFGVSSGKFLGFMVLWKAFEWMDECQQAFEELKKYLATPPLLSPSKPGEELYLYLAVSPTAISSTLLREEEGQQLLVYYTSRAFRGVEERYSPMEKLAFALVTTARKFRPYFQAHTIVLLTNHPLRKAMNKPDAAKRLIQWSIKLSEFDIDYRPRIAIKAQALDDFIAEFTIKDDEPKEEDEQTSKWTTHIDGLSTKNAGGIDIILESPEGDIIERVIRLQYTITNNEAEYEALLTGLKLAQILGATKLDIHSDSQLVVGQVNGDKEAKEECMQQYLNLVRHQISQFREVKLNRIPREQNMDVDQLAKTASSTELDDKIEIVRQSSLQAIEKYIKAFAETTQKHDPYQRRSLEQAIIGHPYKWMPTHSSNTPTVRQPTSLTTRRTHANNGTLAIRAMGVRHHRTIPNRKASAQIPSNHNRLLHQMGESETTSNYN
uniref:RNase H type-1 domain-containing protein n=1 Tax=Fagus sylvatica TaxID=28930 RepID=A0A2N9EIR5_FAGSY